MKFLHRWIAKRLTQIYTCDRHERFVMMAECRGYLYILTDDRLLRYDPEADTIECERPLRRY